jgi:hypothetical protein
MNIEQSLGSADVVEEKQPHHNCHVATTNLMSRGAPPLPRSRV